MANEALVAAIKEILTLAKTGRSDEAYAGYARLYASPEFASYRPEDQRQALKLMVLAKHIQRPPTPTMLEAYRSATGPLSSLLAEFQEPADYEMIGLCQVLLGDEQGAATSFKTGLELERERDPQSVLCGQLMKWVASV